MDDADYVIGITHDEEYDMFELCSIMKDMFSDTIKSIVVEYEDTGDLVGPYTKEDIDVYLREVLN